MRRRRSEGHPHANSGRGRRRRVGPQRLLESENSEITRRVWTPRGGRRIYVASDNRPRMLCLVYQKRQKECKINGFRVNHTLDGAKGRQKLAKGCQKGAKGLQNGAKIHQKSIKMVPKTNTSAKVDFGLPKWYQNGSKMERKGFQHLCKNVLKIDAKINAEKVSENEAKMNQH